MAGDRFEPCFAATGIASLPHRDIQKALGLIRATTPDIPFYPQFPAVSYLENMYVQFAYDLPGAVVMEDARKIAVCLGGDTAEHIEAAYRAFLDGDLEKFAIGRRYASGLYALVENAGTFGPIAAKGQVTGPISLGMTVPDESGRPILYDEVYMDIVVKSLLMRARWLQGMLARVCSRTIVFVDEPCLGQLGSGYFNINRDLAVCWMKEVVGAIAGLRGIHCCSNTDWGLLLSLGVDIVSFDAYNDAKTVVIYPGEISDFIGRGGIISWGIVPNSMDAFEKETVGSLRERLLGIIGELEGKGIDRRRLLRQSMLTTTCGLGGIGSDDDAARVQGLLIELSRSMGELARRA